VKTLALWAAALASIPVLAQSPSGDAVRCKALFITHMCHTCHGSAGQGGPYGPQLAPHALPREAFVHQVRAPRSSMPRYSPQALDDAALADIYAFVASVAAGPKASAIPLLAD
jgi:mono/diheme cytochrome c family protein